MEDLIAEIAALKEKSSQLQTSYEVEKALRKKTETNLSELRRVHEKMAVSGEMEEEKIVNKVAIIYSKISSENDGGITTRTILGCHPFFISVYFSSSLPS